MREEKPDDRSVLEEVSKATAGVESTESTDSLSSVSAETGDVEREVDALLAQVTDVLQTDDVQFEETLIKENLEEVLLMLISLHGETHGKELLADLSELFGTQLSPGTVYPNLHDLEEEEVLSMHTKIRTKEYSVADDTEVQTRVEETMVQHLAFGLLLYAFLSRL